jgi:hypothetical protein
MAKKWLKIYLFADILAKPNENRFVLTSAGGVCAPALSTSPFLSGPFSLPKS